MNEAEPAGRDTGLVHRRAGLRKSSLRPIGWMAVVITLGYGGSLYYRSTHGLAVLQQFSPRFEGQIHRPDPGLGYRLVPEAMGAMVVEDQTRTIEKRSQIRVDTEGFRVATGAGRDRREIVGLALGCSFTFGAGCEAEEAFPFQLGEGLGGRVVNAGVTGYSLAQMLLRARRLVPELRPRYLFVQASGWLSPRASTYALPTPLAATPVPYFVATSEGSIEIARPVFESAFLRLPVFEFHGPTEGWTKSLSFFRRVGLPGLVHDDLAWSWHRLNVWRGAVPKPAAGSLRTEILQASYGELAQLGRQFGSQVVVVVLGRGPETATSKRHAEDLAALGEISGLTVVDVDGHLSQGRDVSEQQAYDLEYSITAGAPARVLDRHPAPGTHARIAELILERLE